MTVAIARQPIRCSEQTFRRFMWRLNHTRFWDLASGLGQPYMIARRGKHWYLTVQDLFDWDRHVLPPVVDIVRWHNDDWSQVRTMAGNADWLADYHLRAAQAWHLGGAEALHVVTEVPRWMDLVAARRPAVCFIGDHLEGFDFRSALLDCGTLICESEALAELIYKGLRKRRPERYPKVEFVPAPPPKRSAPPAKRSALVEARA